MQHEHLSFYTLQSRRVLFLQIRENQESPSSQSPFPSHRFTDWKANMSPTDTPVDFTDTVAWTGETEISASDVMEKQQLVK